MKQKNKIIVAAIAVAVIIGAFFGYRAFWPGSAEPDLAADAVLRAEADKVNPFKQEEAVNPFEESSNPYENIKTNPFE